MKIKRIKDIKNTDDNCWYIVAMFDTFNKRNLLNMVEGETKEWLGELLKFSGIKT